MSGTAIVSIVDDDESVRKSMDGLLRANGYTVRTYASAEAFLASTGPGRTRCLISDIQMPGLSGIQMYAALCAQGLLIPVIFITGNIDAFQQLQTLGPPPIRVFAKPFDCGELIACIETMLAGHA